MTLAKNLSFLQSLSVKAKVFAAFILLAVLTGVAGLLSLTCLFAKSENYRQACDVNQYSAHMCCKCGGAQTPLGAMRSFCLARKLRLST